LSKLNKQISDFEDLLKSIISEINIKKSKVHNIENKPSSNSEIEIVYNYHIDNLIKLISSLNSDLCPQKVDISKKF